MPPGANGRGAGADLDVAAMPTSAVIAAIRSSNWDASLPRLDAIAFDSASAGGPVATSLRDPSDMWSSPEPADRRLK
jgi:hypothetical protein